MYRVVIVPAAVEEMSSVPIFYRRQIEKAVETQLSYEPLKTSRNRKCLEALSPGFEYEPPLWELRVGDWRIFYDVVEINVTIRAIRKKPPARKTEEIA